MNLSWGTLSPEQLVFAGHLHHPLFQSTLPCGRNFPGGCVPKQEADLTPRVVIVATWGGLGAAAPLLLGRILPVLLVAALAWLAVRAEVEDDACGEECF